MNKRSGFSVIELIIILAVLASIALVLVKVRGAKKEPSVTAKPQASATNPDKDPNTPPLKLKSIGFNLDYYDPATGMAGDIKFNKFNLFGSQIVGIFGQHDDRSNDPDRRNPQPTFVLAAGTKVKALVDGVVTNVETLYSGDFSIMVAKDQKSPFIYETEHVINPIVKKGDRVTAGQVIAEVSLHGAPGPGIGILDIGILHPQGTEAGHLCPFRYLDDSIKADVEKKLTSLYKAWNDYLGKTVYDSTNWASPGCVIESWVRG